MNETEFEKSSVELFKDILKDEHVQRLGTRGQAQYGVDIIGHRNGDATKPVGVQCKLKTGNSKLTVPEAKNEIDAALTYQPFLVEYFIVTTAKNDVKLQQYVSKRRQEAAAGGRLIEMSVWGWDTLQEEIDRSPRGKRAFDPGFSPFLQEHGKKLDAVVAQAESTRLDAGHIKTMVHGIGVELKALAKVPQPHADRILSELLVKWLRRRGFETVDAAKEILELSQRAIDGDLSLASPKLRAEICDRTARLQSSVNEDHARKLRDHAAIIDPTRNLTVVDAYLLEASGDVDGALRMLRDYGDVDSNTAMCVVLHRQRGTNAALAWLRERSLGASDLVPAGVANYLVYLRDNGAFDEALAFLDTVPNDYFDEFPILLMLRMQFRIASLLPVEQRPVIFRGLPTDPRVLHLAGGKSADVVIAAADRDLTDLLGVLPSLDLIAFAEIVEEFLLWLRLTRPATRDAARTQLGSEISDPRITLRRVRLALAYGVPFNRDALQRHLDAQHNLGGWSSDERFAAFLLTFASDDPKKIADFIERYYDELFSRSDFDPAALAGIEVEAVARAGDFESSYDKIATYTGRYFTAAQAEDIRQLILGLEGGNEVEELRKRFDASNSAFDLRMLVGAIVAANDKNLLAQYAPDLARRTKTQADFEFALRALGADHPDGLLTLVDDLPELFALDLDYAAAKGWALYQTGRVLEARVIARDLLMQRANGGDRELAINTAIETGDWGFLQKLVADAAASVDGLAVPDLIRLTRLAFEAESPYVDQLRDAALARAPTDPNVNLMAHMLAIESGDERAGTYEWLDKAAAHSSDEGPVKTISMRELVDDIPRRSQHLRDLGLAIRRGEMPLFVAAAGLNRQLLDLTWGQAIRNTDSNLSGAPIPIPSFVGHRPPLLVPTDLTVAFDLSSLITLEYADLLDAVLGHFPNIVIAPQTLASLFVDRQFVRVQQPSQIARAERIQGLIAAGGLKVLHNGERGAPTLVRDIGEDLASLIAEARKENGVVVRTAPVPRVGSFLDEVVSMDSHAGMLVDTREVLRFLLERGAVDAALERRAEGHLTRVDQGWPGGATLTGSSRIYLDDLAATYLDQVGLLGILVANVAAVFIESSLDEETRQTIRHGHNAAALLDAIERIRTSIAKGLERGCVRFSRRHNEELPEGKRQRLRDRSPTMDLLADLSAIGVVVADDRALSKGGVWTDGSGHGIPCATSLDVLATIRSDGRLEIDAYWRARHRLRIAGFYPTPLEADELLHHVRRAPVNDGTIRETPELAAIRGSIALALVGEVYLASDHAWLAGVRHAFVKALQQLWLDAPEDGVARAQSDWLLDHLPDPTEWCVNPEDADTWLLAEQQLATQVSILLLLPSATSEVQGRYYAWLSEKLIEPMRRERPAIWRDAIRFMKDFLARFVDDDNDDDSEEI